MLNNKEMNKVAKMLWEEEKIAYEKGSEILKKKLAENMKLPLVPENGVAEKIKLDNCEGKR